MRFATLACAMILVGGAAHAAKCPPGQVLRNGECVEIGRHQVYHHHVLRHGDAAREAAPGGTLPPRTPRYRSVRHAPAAPATVPLPSPPPPAPVGIPAPPTPIIVAPILGRPAPIIPGSRPVIEETGYAALFKVGNEMPGYGLYSYVILAFRSDKSAALLAEIIKSTIAASQLSINKKNINALYIPIANGKQAALTQVIRDDRNDLKKLGNDVDDIYDFGMARQILDHVCTHAPSDMQVLCRADTSGGPYIFTYTAPATSLDNYPPPYLFVDLTKVPEGAFPEWLSAYRSQVKQKDIHDGTWVKTFRLKLLDYAMMASSLITPVEGSVKDTIDSYIHPLK